MGAIADAPVRDIDGRSWLRALEWHSNNGHASFSEVALPMEQIVRMAGSGLRRKCERTRVMLPMVFLSLE